jgi:type IV secretory pathway VirD2 relaxase
MRGEDDFTPRLGRLGDAGAAGGKRFRQRVAKAAARLAKPAGKPGFTGSRYGRGAVAGRMASVRDRRLPRHRMRRVTVKVHIARSKSGAGRAAFNAHLKYLQRDGVDRDGRGGELYSSREEGIGAREFLERSGSDRHQFRIIVSPEDGDQMGDLKSNTRQLMDRMESDLGTRLDWIAVDHHNTGHPHTHVVIRGKDQLGRDLIIAREYLTQGLRRQAEDLVTQTLGPRRDLEIMRARQSEISQDRFTGIDRQLLSEAREGIVAIPPPSTSADRFQRSLKLARLNHLEGLRLASRTNAAQYQLQQGWDDTLRQMGRRGDIIRTLSASHTQARIADLKMFETRAPGKGAILGEVIASGPADELRDTRYLLVREFGGGTWHVDAGGLNAGSMPPKGAIVEVSTAIGEPRASDRTIARIAERSGGIYTDALHAAAEPGSSAAYRLAHKRRLEALRRAGIVMRNSDGSWQVRPDFLDRAASYERVQNGAAKIVVRSWISLSEQIAHPGATWLDSADQSVESRNAEFGAATQARRDHLRKQGLLGTDDVRLSEEVMGRLRSQELVSAASNVSKRTGQREASLQTGKALEGRLQSTIDLGQGRLGVVGNGKEFVLVPWRRDLGQYFGREITVAKTGQGITWTMGVDRSIGMSR